jgi:polyferredoxin
MKKVRMFFGKVHRRLNVFLVLGGLVTSVGFYKIWPYLNGDPAPLVKEGVLVSFGLVLLYIGMMNSAMDGYESSE